MNFTEQFVKAAFSREKVENVMVYFTNGHAPAPYPKRFALSEMVGDPEIKFIESMETGEILWPE